MSRPIVGFFAGTFDLCHAGHTLSFKEARAHCDTLVAGLQTNPNIDRPNKNIPIMSMDERRIILAGVRYIDAIREYDTEKDLIELVRDLKPDIYFIGEDWKGKVFSCKAVCEEMGIAVHYLSRNHPYSTSELRKRIAASEA